MVFCSTLLFISSLSQRVRMRSVATRITCHRCASDWTSVEVAPHHKAFTAQR